MGPLPVLIDSERIRVYLTVLDGDGRGRPTFVDVSASDPSLVIHVADYPLMDVGQPGDFDDNGLMPLSVVRVGGGSLFLYYAGFELCTKIRYRIFSGLAISKDDGLTFDRLQSTPVLDRSPEERFFRGGPFVLRDDGKYKLWYVAGSSWESIDGKDMPVYELRYQESSDGISWGSKGLTCLAISGGDEHGFGRPWVVKLGDGRYEMFYSIRRRSVRAYRLGYAISEDGIKWQRRDDALGLDVVEGTFASTAIMYSAVITVKGRTFCFYNGDDFGRAGFAVAERIA